MKKTNLICGIFSALLLLSPLVSADSEYPAYDFKPTIVYQDESVIAQIEATKAAQAAATESAPTGNSAAVAGDGAAEASADDSTLLIGILALAGIIFVAYKKSADAGKPKRPAATSASTGVSRYLDKHAQAGAAVSGVEKYLQERG